MVDSTSSANIEDRTLLAPSALFPFPHICPHRDLSLKVIGKLLNRLRTFSFSELARGSSRAFAFRVMGIGISYLFAVTVTRLLGKEAYGSFTLLQTFLMLGLLLARSGMDTALLRNVSRFRSEGKEYLLPGLFKKASSFVLGVGTLLGLIVFFTAPSWSSFFFDDPKGDGPMKWVAIGIPLMGMVFLSSEALRGLKRIGEATALRNLFPFLTGALVVFLAPEKGAFLPFQGYLLGIFLAALSGLFLWTKRVGWRGRTDHEELGARSLLGLAFPLFLTGSMFFIMNWIDALMIGGFRSEAELGVYSAAMRVSNLNNVALFAVNAIAAPKFSEMYWNGELERLSVFVQRATGLTLMVVFPLFLILLIFPEFVLSLFGTGFGEGRTALILLAIGKFANAASGSVMYFLQMSGGEKVGHRILLVAAIANVLLNLFLIPNFGIEGAAWASMLSIAGWNFYGAYYIHRKYGIKTFFWPFISKKRSE